MTSDTAAHPARNEQPYDVVIIGAGMVGASLVAALLPAARRLRLRLALVEAIPLTDHQQPSYDDRATALAYGSAALYQQLGVWQQVAPQAAAIQHIHVSDRGHWGSVRLAAAQEQVPALGYVVENRWLGQCLHQHINNHPDRDMLDYYCPAQVDTLTPLPNGMQLQLNGPAGAHTLHADLVVMADGGRSQLREQLGLHYQKVDYQQQAIIANISPDRPHRGIAYERFTADGPVALLPLTDRQQPRCALVWTVPNAQCQPLLAADDATFLAAFTQHFGYRAGRFTKVGQRTSYPLQRTWLEEQVRSNLVVLGNAAHTLHPIAGQGYNLALRGAVDLAAHLIAARQRHQPLGDLAMLQAFQDSRLADQQRTISTSEKIMQLFSTSHPLLGLGRSIGLSLLNNCPSAKHLFAQAAMGLDVPAPQLNPGASE